MKMPSFTRSGLTLTGIVITCLCLAQPSITIQAPPSTNVSIIPSGILTNIKTMPLGAYNAQAPCLADEVTNNYIQQQTALDPNYTNKVTQQNMNLQQWVQNYSQGKKKVLSTIPVVVHVLYNPNNSNSPDENVPDSYIFAMIQTLNEDYQRLNADASQTRSQFVSVAADAQIEFCLATKDAFGASTNGITRTSTIEGYFDPNTETNDMKSSSGTNNGVDGWDATKYLNIWICNISNYANFGTAGYAYLPTPGMHGSSIDGLVIDFKLGVYYSDRTATHEIGHYLGLKHTWGNNLSCSNDDGHADTPNSSSENYGCNYSENSCSGGDVDQIENYMSYSSCQNMFSTDQSNYMNSVLSSTRASLLSSNGCEPTAAPVCDFTSDKTTVQAGGLVNFTDISTGVPDTYSWNFGGGGTPNTSTLGSPAIQFNAIGTYTVSLTVTNGLGNDSNTKTGYITVTAPLGCDTVNWSWLTSNSMYIYNADAVAPDDTGYISGTNAYGDISKAQLFTVSEYAPNTHVTGGLFYFSTAYKDPSSSAQVIFRVWDSDGTAGAPNTVLGADTMDLADIMADAQAGFLTQSLFDLPVQVTSDFYYGWTMFNFDAYGGPTADTLVTVQSQNGTSASASVPWEQWNDDTWHDYPSAWGFTTTTIFVAPYVTDQPPTANFVATSTTSGCKGLDVTFDGSASSNAYEYLWDIDGDGFYDYIDTVDGLITVTYDTVGTFNVTLMVVGPCTGLSKYTLSSLVTITDGPSLNATAVNASCGTCNGSASVSVTGGATPYTYLWNNPGSTTNSGVSSLCPGSYQVQVTDASGCGDIAGVTVSDPASMTISTTATNALCGNANGTASAVTSGGTTPYSYIWDDPSGQITQTATGLGAGTYNVTVTDAAGCVVETDFFGAATVSASGAVGGSITTSSDPSCNGSTDGQASALATGGNGNYTYSWSTSPAQITATATGLSGGVLYTVTITDGAGCNTTVTVTLTSPVAISVSVSTVDATCGNADGSATIVVNSGGTPPYTYLWNDVGAQTSAMATGLSAGPYSVTVTDANNCTVATPVAVTDGGAPAVTPTGSSLACNGDADGTAMLSANGGAPPYNYSWNTIPAQTSATATGLGAGTYTGTVTDAAGCSASVNATVVEPTAISGTVTATNSSCTVNDGTVTISASGGSPTYSYLWNDGASQVTQTATGLGTGSYTVVVTDGNGCTYSATGAITSSNAPTLINSATNESCSGSANGTATVTATGGTPPYSYLWSDSNAQTLSIAGGLVSGTYTVTVTDASGCSAMGNSTVTSTGGPTVSTTSTNASCGGSDGAAAAMVSGGATPYTYLWDDPSAQNNATAINLAAGSYNVVVTDASGCVVNASVVVGSSGGATVTTTSLSENCGNGDGSATASVIGGTPPYSYLWDDPSTQNVSTAIGLSAGTYTVIITDGSGCTASSSVTVGGTTGPSVSTSVTGSSCGNTDGTATVNATGGLSPYTYLWSDASAQTSATAIGLGAGSYTIQVTDANGCISSEVASVSDVGAPSINTNSNDVTCNGDKDGSSLVTASGGTAPYTYQWNDPAFQTSAAATSLSGGTFSVTVTDAVGCKAITSVTIIEPSTLKTVTSMVATTPSLCTGSATANVIGGTTPYTYLWGDPGAQSTPTAVGLCAGAYSVLIIDANGCDISTNVTVVDAVGIGEIENSLKYNMYPNPSSGDVFIELKLVSQANVEIRVFNAIGELVSLDILDNISEYKHIMNCANYTGGIYYVHLLTAEEMFVNKIIIVK